MYIRAIIKKRDGDQVTVKAMAGCDVIFPISIPDRFRYAFATNKLLADFLHKIKPYANKDHAIVEIQTDNVFVIERLSKEYEVHYVPEVSEIAEGEPIEK